MERIAQNKKEPEAPEQIIINVEDTVMDTSKYKTGPELSTWGKDGKPTKEYDAMEKQLFTLIRYIAKQLNEGPEVNESSVKRSALLTVLLEHLINQTFLDGYHKYGVVLEVCLDTYMDCTGKTKTAQFLLNLHNRTVKRSSKKTNLYVS